VEPVIVNKQTRASILENPERHGADIIGQGVYFIKKDAKKMAATKALQYLEKRGYKKAAIRKDRKE